MLCSDVRCYNSRSILLSSCLFALLSDLEVVIHILCGANEDWCSLMDASRLDIEDGFGAAGCLASSLLNEVRHRTALIQQTKLKGKRERGREGGREREKRTVA